MTPLLKITRFFLLASIATTFIKIPSFHEYYRIGDVLLLVSFIALIIAFLKGEISLLQDKKLLHIVLFWIGVNAIGTLTSYILYKELPAQMVILNAARLISCLIIFSEIILLARKDTTIIKCSILCLIGSLTIIPLAYFLHYIGTIDYLMYDPSRFSGLLIDPNYFASLQIIPTIFLLFFVMKKGYTVPQQIVLYGCFVFSVAMILWSGSRSGILGLLISLGVMGLFFIFFSQSSKKRAALMLVLVGLSIPAGFLLIPKYHHLPLQIGVVVPVATTTEPINSGSIPTSPQPLPPIESRVESFTTVSGVTAGKGRFEIWKNSLPFILKNPLGYGPGYNNIINIHGEGYEHRVVHNFELELLLQGGIFLFIFCNFFIIKLLVTTYKSVSFKKYNEIHALIAILLGLLVSALFLDSIPQKWIWAIIALIIASNYATKKQNEGVI